MRNYWCLLLLLFSGPFYSRVLGAESSSETSITVEELVQQVLQRNPEIKFYDAEIAAAQGERRSAGKLGNPELSGSLGAKRTRESGRLAGEGAAWSVSLQQPFDWPGRLALRKAIANREVALAELGRDRFHSALAGKVRLRAMELANAQDQARVARMVAERFRVLTETVLQRDPAGVTPLLEQRILEANAISFRRKASDLSAAARGALIEINQWRGENPTQPLEIQPVSIQFGPLPEWDALVGAALTNHFELRARIQELEQQGLKIQLARSEKWPAFQVGPFYAEEKAGERETTIGLEFSMPLPLWNRNEGGVQVAQAREEQARVSLAMAQRALEKQIAEEILLYREKLSEMESWKADAIERLEEAATLADEHYRLGAVPIGTYADLQEKYLEAMETLARTRMEAAAGLLALEQWTGLKLLKTEAAR